MLIVVPTNTSIRRPFSMWTVLSKFLSHELNIISKYALKYCIKCSEFLYDLDYWPVCKEGFMD